MTSPWWKGAVIYQVYPRSFADSNGDGVGDLRGLIARLPYIQELGVDAIWLSPVFTSPMKDFGYDVSDYRQIDPLFGTLKDFDELLSSAHRLGLKLLIDQVYSHTSDRHPWFQDSRYGKNGKSDWYVWADAQPDGSPPNNWLSVFGGPAWSWDTVRRQYYLHNFLREQPDLNFHSEAVQDAVLDIAQFWLDRGIDGFRLDVANYFVHDASLRSNPPSERSEKTRPYHFQTHLYNRSRPESLGFAERFRDLLNAYPGTVSLAEIFSDAPAQRSADYTAAGRRYHTAYSFSFLHQDNLTAELIKKSVKAWPMDDAWPSWTFGNHDVARVASRWAKGSWSPDQAKQLFVLLTALQGTAIVYQGEELGLPQADVPFECLKDPEAIRFYPDNLGRDGGRTPMVWNKAQPHGGFTAGEPWLPIGQGHLDLAVDAQEADKASILHAARTWLALRREKPVFRTGTLEFLDTDEPLLAFHRQGSGEHFILLFNLGLAPLTVPAELCRTSGAAFYVQGYSAGMLEGFGFLIAEYSTN